MARQTDQPICRSLLMIQAVFFFLLQNLRECILLLVDISWWKIPLIFVPSQRIENRWTSDGKKEVFPLVLIQEGRVEKCTVLDLKNKREKGFLPFKTQLFHIQVVRRAASENNKNLA